MADNKRIFNGNENTWVEFKKSGYPFKLSRQLKDSNKENEILDIVLGYVTACHIPTLDDAWLDAVATKDALDNVDEQLVVWVIREFYEFRQERMYSPLALPT